MISDMLHLQREQLENHLNAQKEMNEETKKMKMEFMGLKQQLQSLVSLISAYLNQEPDPCSNDTGSHL